jgi:hypothetical protein
MTRTEYFQVRFCPIVTLKLYITTALEFEVLIRYIVKHQDKMYSMPHLSYLVDGEKAGNLALILTEFLEWHVVTASRQFPDNCVFS